MALACHDPAPFRIDHRHGLELTQNRTRSRRRRRTGLSLVICAVLGAGLPVQAQDAHPNLEQLAAQVHAQAVQLKQQARHIRKLEKKLAQLESIKATTTRYTDKPDGADDTTGIHPHWTSSGIRLSSDHGADSISVSGRIHYDLSGTRGSRFDARNSSGTEFRRLWLRVKGKADGWLGYALQVGLEQNEVNVKDAYLSASGTFSGRQFTLYAGQKKSTPGIDGMTSSNDLWFMEANTVAQSMQPERGSRGLGLVGVVHDPRHHWHLMLGVTNGSVDRSEPGTLAYVARAHWNPYLTDRAMVHLGAWGVFENYNRNDAAQIRAKTRLATHFASPVQVIGPLIIDPDSSTSHGVSLAGYLGPFAAAAEHGHRHIRQRQGAGNRETGVDAWSASISWFLTGQKTPYSSQNGTWEYPQVGDDGAGAWQLVARYQKLDMSGSAPLPGGTGHDLTLGLNWYLGRHARLMFNWTRWATDNLDGPYLGKDTGNTVGARAQVTF